MIILDATTRSLQIKLAGAITTNQLPFVASFIELDATSTFTPKATPGQTNNTTAVTVMAAPSGGSLQRQLKELSVKNADTVNATVIVEYNDNATIREIYRATLLPHDSLFYLDGSEGWYVLDSNGQKKSNAGQRSSDETSTIYNSTTALTPKFMPIAAASSGNNTLVSGVATKKIRVLAMTLIAAGTVNIYFTSSNGGTVIFGGSTNKINLVANTGFATGYSPVGHFETVAGEALVVNNSGAVAVSGGLTYIEV